MNIEAALRAKLAAEEPEPGPTKARPTPPSVPKAAEPKTAETPKVALTEPAPIATPAAAPEVTSAKPADPPPDLGRGGAQHKAMQQRLKAEAERLGFHATIEKAVPNGGVDVALELSGCTIACEISVTTTIDHEVGNVQKCRRAGFHQVVVICQDTVRLEKIRLAVSSSLTPEERPGVGYFTLDEFLTRLAAMVADLPPQVGQPASESQTVRRGYQVKRKSAALSPEERQAREQVGITQMAGVMKQRKKP